MIQVHVPEDPSNHVAALLFTSGSSGQPKGAIYTDNKLYVRCRRQLSFSAASSEAAGLTSAGVLDRHSEFASGRNPLTQSLSFIFTNLAYTTPHIITMGSLFAGGGSYFRRVDSSTTTTGVSVGKMVDFSFFEQLRAAGPASVSAPPRVWTLLKSQFNVEVQSVFDRPNGRFVHPDRRPQVRAAVVHAHVS